MNRNSIIVLAAVVVLGAAGLALSGHKKAPIMVNSNNSQSSPDNIKPVESNAVSIRGFAFNAPDIKIKIGSTVTWTNDDNVTHTVNEIDGKTGPNSGNLSPGSTYKFNYNSTGTFHYHCNIHEDMLGTVTVSS